MLNHALKYLKQGLSVIPLEPRGKKPLIKWEEFQTRRASPDEIKEWFQKWPTANLGVITGEISHTCVVDLDGPLGMAEASRLGIVSSVVSLTGEGKHLWYKWTKEVRPSASKVAPNVDIRGDGSYVVAPPSIHATGRRYRWVGQGIVNHALLNTTFPDCLLGIVVSSKVEAKSDSWISEALEEIKNGHVHNTLVRVLGKFRAHNFSEEDTISLLSPFTHVGGLELSELRSKVSEIWGRYPAGYIDGTNLALSQLRDRTFDSAIDQSTLVIHSPTNPDSLKQFEQRMFEVDGDWNKTRLQTGYTKLDQMLKGGLKSSRLFTVAARTGVGKTNWLISVARTLCESGHRVLLFSTEMPYAQIWERYIQTLDDRESFKEHKLYVCDSFAPNLERVEEAINEIKPDVFMFDHINHVSEEQRELGAFMQGLNFLKRKYECAGVVTAQLNRSADWVDLKTGEKVTPRMSMIKGSGTIEQASSRVLLLSETRVTPEGTEIVGNLDKNDNGPKGLLHFMLRSNPYKMEEIV